MNRSKYLLGLSGIKREMFKFTGIPEQKDFPQFKACIGPFRTKRACLWALKYGGNNPHFQHANDAEKLSKLL